MIIFENENYLVHALEGDSDYFLVTFSGLRAEEVARGTFFAEAACRKLGLACAGIVSKHEDWYTSPGLEDALRAVQNLSRAYPVVYGYGSSMGAYCAIKHSRALNFRACLALAPQWSLDPDEFLHRSHFDAFFSPQMRGMGVREDEMAGLVHVIIDEREETDCRHAEKLQKIYGDTHVVTLPRCGHNIAPFIKGTQQLRALLSVIDDPAGLKARIRRIRRSNIEHLSHTLLTMVERKPHMVGCALLSRRAETIGLASFVYRHHRRLVGVLVFDLMRKGRKTDAIRLMAGSLPVTGRDEGRQYRDIELLFSHLGEYICLNPVTQKLSSSKGTIPTNGFPLAILGRELVGLTWSGHVYVGLELEKDPVSGFASIVKESGYVSVLPNGEVVANRTSRNMWEMFVPMPIAAI